jgi:hypothetical protein
VTMAAVTRSAWIGALLLCLACVALPAQAQTAAPANPAAPGIEPMVATAEKQAATEFAMVVALTRTAVAGQCQALPEPTRSRAAQALADWRARNRATIDPLLPWVNYMAGIDATDEEQFQKARRVFLGGYKAKAVTLARIELGTTTPDAAACGLALKRFDDVTRDLARSRHGPELQAIAEFVKRLSTPPASR